MTEPTWLLDDLVLAIHEAQLAEHGGLNGIRDRGLLESALARPKNLYSYSEGRVNLNQLAAAYAVGIGRNHAFNDGNKRTAWFAAATFLEINGRQVTVSQAAVVHIMLAVADGTAGEEQFVQWLEEENVPQTAGGATR